MDTGWTSQPSACDARTASSTARSFRTGIAPGSPRQTGQMLVFGGAPNVVLQPQKILLAVSSWQWISRPMTGSSEDTLADDYGQDRRRLPTDRRQKTEDRRQETRGTKPRF